MSKLGKRNWRHGRAYTKEYQCWYALKARCTNPNNEAYESNKDQLCHSWFRFINFFSDMGEKPTPKSVLVRLDNTKLYGPGNVRWGTMKEVRALRRKDNRVNRTNILKKYVGNDIDEDWISVYF